jgi:hypothetical protein
MTSTTSGNGDTVTHVIAYLPSYLLGRKSRRDFPDGMWDLQEVAAYNAAEPPSAGDWSLEAGRDADPAELAAWAAEVLGYPVLLEADSTKIWPAWMRLPVGRGRTEPLYNVRPAAK